MTDEIRRVQSQLEADYHHINSAIDAGSVALSLAAVKRAQRHSRLLARLLAEHRDTLQP